MRHLHSRFPVVAQHTGKFNKRLKVILDRPCILLSFPNNVDFRGCLHLTFSFLTQLCHVLLFREAAVVRVAAILRLVASVLSYSHIHIIIRQLSKTGLDKLLFILILGAL
jgi:hypothetical protein